MARSPLGLAAVVAAGVLASSGRATAQSTMRVVHSFTAGGPLSPLGSLLEGRDGNLYGTSFSGGALNDGTVFRITPAGELRVLHTFAAGSADGAGPGAGLIQAIDGNFYGTTDWGGASDRGTVFLMNPGGAVTILHAFTRDESGAPGTGIKVWRSTYSSLIQASDGNLYGTMSKGGVYHHGAVFKITLAGALTIVHSFADNGDGYPILSSPDGAYPHAALIQGVDGNFYGTTYAGGAMNLGTIFKMTPEGTVTLLHSFTGGTTDGRWPDGALVQGADGNLYGTTPFPSSPYIGIGVGTIFKVTPAGAFTILNTFSSPDAPSTALIEAADGNFYGGSGVFGIPGTIFKMTPDGAITIVHAFSGGTTDGASPYTLIQATDGNFYGKTGQGGGPNRGTVFRMSPAGTVTLLHTFADGGPEGGRPYAAVIRGTDGNFYGTTSVGGAADLGTVFKITEAGNATVLHSFTGGATDGATCRTGLVQGVDGNFYGTTQDGGTEDWGTVFRMTPAGVVTILHSFTTATTDGRSPRAALIQATDGSFYGTTYFGGAEHGGTVFKVTPDGGFNLVHSFAGGPTDGNNPQAGLIQAADGDFYGTTSNGGAAFGGTVFKVTATGTFTLLHSFESTDANWKQPVAALVQASDGSFYGTTFGVVHTFGGVFKITAAGVFSKLPNGMGASGEHPQAALIQTSDLTKFYGTTEGGGVSDAGTVFIMLPNGNGGLLHAFTGTDGKYPQASLLQSPDGALWGTTSAGGAFSGGTVFRLRATSEPFTDFLEPRWSVIRAVHITELRVGIDAVRAGLGLPAFAWADPVLAGGTSVIKAQHILDLRTALAQAYNAAFLPAPTYTDPTLGPGTTMKTSHILELREALVAIELER